MIDRFFDDSNLDDADVADVDDVDI